ncbi:MAG TPA: glutamate formimidoyltransferase [Acidobacteriota bacterium]|nr:glutamate formimidoyltransferase [Acidobacteriota bacterium]HQF86872.1 glutamate formimidoyltransferase [Acidobacteriota bacterium]HQG91330.1 glutamate formimidoyltransferase [Acidobacteriota bacterium]
MKQLVECVPNFSEGRDRALIDKIVAAIAAVKGVKVLDVDPGADTNRTVVTLIGEPAPVAEAAFQGIRRAAELIDMAKHSGAHPRIGATDVCPFVPVSGVTMADCAELARQVGRRVGEELGIPVYLYEAAAATPLRVNLADVRAGEYEGLADKLRDPAWTPDFGPATFNARAGATVIGAREFLIAYNINFNTRDAALVNDIALEIREKGRVKKDAKGAVVKDAQGEKVWVPGRFKAVKAIGWYIEQYGCAQLSINFNNYKISPVHEVFVEVCRQAEARGLRVTGSELVGLIPKQALLDAGAFFLTRQGKPAGVPDEELIHIAVKSLGLAELTPFDPLKKIIEASVEAENPPRLQRMNLREFANELSSDSPAPGGGSVAALAGSLAAALAAMVSNLTAGKKGYEEQRDRMLRVGVEGQRLKDEFLSDIDRDTEAFNEVMAAIKLPKKTDAEKAARGAAMETANKGATLVPLGVLRRAVPALELVREMARHGNRNSISDAGVGGLMGLSAAEGAYYNVMINLKGIEDGAFRDATSREARALLKQAEKLAAEIRDVVCKELEG